MEKSGILKYERQGDIAFLKLDNPPKNRLPKPAIADPEAIQEWLSSPDLRGAVLYGDGNHFCEGADTAFLEDEKLTPEELTELLREGKKALAKLINSPVPIVAAIKGACMGGGLEIALACHLRVAAATSLFGFPEGDLGLLPGLGGTLLAAREIGSFHALPMILSSKIISGEEAERLGFVHYAVPKKDVLEKAMKVLQEMIGDKAPDVIHRITTCMANVRRMSIEEALDEETRHFCELFSIVRQEQQALSSMDER